MRRERYFFQRELATTSERLVYYNEQTEITNIPIDPDIYISPDHLKVSLQCSVLSREWFLLQNESCFKDLTADE